MLHYIKSITKIEEYKVTCVFNTNETVEVDLAEKLHQYAMQSPSLFGKLLDKQYFSTVQLDSYGTLSWDNEIDFCPDVLYHMGKVISSTH